MAAITGKTEELSRDTLRYWLTAVALAVTRPTAWEIAIWVTVPDDNGTGGTEISLTGYSRQTVSFTAPTLATPAVTDNDALITFGAFTAGGPQTATGFTIHATAPGTQLLYGGPLDTNRTLENDDKAEFAIGAANCTEA